MKYGNTEPEIINMNKIYKIYKISFPNGKYYIGLTYNINKRWKEHLNDTKRYDYKLYRAILKYKITLDDFSIIEDNILTKDEANTKEQYYIKLYDSYNNGYNSTIGGDSINSSIIGEKHPKAKITDKELYNIRFLRYTKKYTLLDIYELYKNKCSLSGFEKLWNYYSRSNIASEYNTDELRIFYKTDIRNRRGNKHVNTKISDEDVINIRNRYYINGETSKEIYKDYNNIYSYSGFIKLISGESHKHIPMPKKSLKCVKKLDKLTDDEVINLRKLYDSGKTIKELHVGKYLNYNICNFKNMLIRKTYKHVNY